MKFFSKKQVAGIFDNPQSPLFTVVNDVLSVATIVSIIAIVLETVPALQKYNSIFLIIEWVAVILFTIEYVLRFWSTKKRSDYTLSLYGIIDLVAILPTYFGLGNFTFLKSARVIRIIRFLRLSRMTKLSKINMKDAEETLGVFGFNIALYATSITFVMLVLGVALHVFISGGRYLLERAKRNVLGLLSVSRWFTRPNPTWFNRHDNFYNHKILRHGFVWFTGWYGY